VFAQQTKAVKENGVLKLLDAQGHYLLGYQYTIKYPPPGIDSAFGRAGFIHPLKTLSGKVLTRIQPPDHRHHYGLWNPWTHMQYKGKIYDLWNLGEHQGTVKHVQFNRIVDDSSAVGFSAKHAHVAFTGPGQETELLDEDWEIMVTPIDDKRYRCDLRSVYQVPIDDTVTLVQYRYAGLGLRATEQWTNQNSKVLTSSGKTRKDADGSLERWILVYGKVDGADAGVLFLSYPDNFNHPEPVRVWPEQENKGRGDVFVNFSPTKNKDWPLAPHQTYQLRYRLIVFDGTLSAAEAEAFWKDFAKK